MNKRIVNTLWALSLLTVVAVAANSWPSHVDVNGTDRSIKRFATLATASGDNKLVDGVDSHLVRLVFLGVHSYGATAVNWYLKNDTNANLWGSAGAPFTADPTGATGPMGEYMPFNPVGSIRTGTAGEDLEINLSAAVPLWVTGNYVIEPE